MALDEPQGPPLAASSRAAGAISLSGPITGGWYYGYNAWYGGYWDASYGYSYWNVGYWGYVDAGWAFGAWNDPEIGWGASVPSSLGYGGYSYGWDGGWYYGSDYGGWYYGTNYVSGFGGAYGGWYGSYYGGWWDGSYYGYYGLAADTLTSYGLNPWSNSHRFTSRIAAEFGVSRGPTKLTDFVSRDARFAEDLASTDVDDQIGDHLPNALAGSGASGGVALTGAEAHDAVSEEAPDSGPIDDVALRTKTNIAAVSVNASPLGIYIAMLAVGGVESGESASEAAPTTSLTAIMTQTNGASSTAAKAALPVDQVRPALDAPQPQQSSVLTGTVNGFNKEDFWTYVEALSPAVMEFLKQSDGWVTIEDKVRFGDYWFGVDIDDVRKVAGGKIVPSTTHLKEGDIFPLIWIDTDLAPEEAAVRLIEKIDHSNFWSNVLQYKHLHDDVALSQEFGRYFRERGGQAAVTGAELMLSFYTSLNPGTEFVSDANEVAKGNYAAVATVGGAYLAYKLLPRLLKLFPEGLGKPEAAEAFELIDRFRTKSSDFEALGARIPAKGDGLGSVAITEVGGRRFFGVNSSVLSDSSKDLGRKFFDLMKSKGYLQGATHYGMGTAQVLTHAETHALMRAWEKTGGHVGKTVTLFVDRHSCSNCKRHLYEVMEVMGIEKLIIHSKNGITITLP